MSLFLAVGKRRRAAASTVLTSIFTWHLEASSHDSRFFRSITLGSTEIRPERSLRSIAVFHRRFTVAGMIDLIVASVALIRLFRCSILLRMHNGHTHQRKRQHHYTNSLHHLLPHFFFLYTMMCTLSLAAAFSSRYHSLSIDRLIDLRFSQHVLEHDMKPKPKRYTSSPDYGMKSLSPS